MVTEAITNSELKICYAEDMDLRPYSAKNLVQARLEKGWSQSQLAKESDVSVSTIAKLEQEVTVTGKKPVSPSAEVLSKLGRALGIYFVIVWGEVDEDSQIIFRNKKNSGD
ncbi:MAG: helix-turn-helix domain-containing protein [Candidatus Sericytochromatia bacterium]